MGGSNSRALVLASLMGALAALDGPTARPRTLTGQRMQARGWARNASSYPQPKTEKNRTARKAKRTAQKRARY